MNSVIDELFKKARSKEKEVNSDAVTALSVVLEMHAWGLSKEERISRFGSLVSQEVVEVNINESEQTEIVKFLYDEVANGSELTAGLLFAMGQASSKVGLIPLIKLIEKHLDRFNENEVYQALVALERLLFFNESFSIDEEREIINKTNLLVTISKRILSFQPISRVDLESTSLRLLASLILLLNNNIES